jgi:hypothetical protein
MTLPSKCFEHHVYRHHIVQDPLEMATEAGNDAALDLLFSKVPEYRAISQIDRFALVSD